MHLLELRVDAGTEATADQLDRQVKSLYLDLRTLGLLRVERKQTAPPPGSMAGAGYELGVLVLSGAFSAAALKAVSTVVVEHLRRSKARAVEWEFGDFKGTFDALSAHDQRTLVEALAPYLAASAEQGAAAASQGQGAGQGGDGGPGGDDGGSAHRTAGRD
ncbi:hypothetical protein AB0M39_18210 [Streptomyces sp. NPDC051907]|uniref:hypothetical protein n=1 Tax=Streptomyces sp. NPDC051907 TaxID=3155284 RepID=UPI0034463965